jgi:hypothetical protein
MMAQFVGKRMCGIRDFLVIEVCTSHTQNWHTWSTNFTLPSVSNYKKILEEK